MNYPKTKLAALAMGAMMMSTAVQANTPLLENTDFVGTDPWIAGSNLFGGGGTVWKSFATLEAEDRITRSGNSVTFTSYDDGESDKIESYLFQEYGAGPATGTTPTIFETGDVIVFKGTARATRTGANTSDMVVRAFIKTLGYNDLGWEFQTKEQYSDFHPIGATDESFELSITYPNLAEDDSLQVIQLGFEITTSYDAGPKAMDSGTITFSNLEGYVVGDVDPGPTTWLGYTVDETGYVDTGAWMGMLWTGAAPWIWSPSLGKWVYIPANVATAGGEWTYFLK